MSVVGPGIIIFESIWIFVLLIRCNVLKRALDRMTGYLTAMISNKSILDESISTVALAYGLEHDDVIKILEVKSNESKNIKTVSK